MDISSSITNLIKQTSIMIQMGKITEGQKNSLLNKHFIQDGFFNPVQDINGDWFISQEEMQQCDNPPFIWVKTLGLVDFVPIPHPMP